MRDADAGRRPGSTVTDMALTDSPRPVSDRPGAPLPAPPSPAQPSRLTRLLCAAGAISVTAGALGYIYAKDPNLSSSAYPQCALKSVTGIDCPGCGGLRATHALLHGDFAGALDHNAFALLIVPVIGFLVVRFVLEQFDVRLPAPRLAPWMAWSFIVALGVFTVLRNINVGPFVYFASGTA